MDARSFRSARLPARELGTLVGERLGGLDLVEHVGLERALDGLDFVRQVRALHAAVGGARDALGARVVLVARDPVQRRLHGRRVHERVVVLDAVLRQRLAHVLLVQARHAREEAHGARLGSW